MINEPVEIPIGATKACIRLEAVDDEIIEADEIFILVIETIHSNDSIDGNTTVVISDNDCKITAITIVRFYLPYTQMLMQT